MLLGKDLMLLAHVNKRHINDLDLGRSNLNPRCCPFPSTPHALKPETPDLFPRSIERDLLITRSADLRETYIASRHLTSRLTRVLPCLHVGHPSPLSNVVDADGPVSIAACLERGDKGRWRRVHALRPRHEYDAERGGRRHGHGLPKDLLGPEQVHSDL